MASSNELKYAPELDLYGPVKLPPDFGPIVPGNGGAENTQILIRDACNPLSTTRWILAYMILTTMALIDPTYISLLCRLQPGRHRRQDMRVATFYSGRRPCSADSVALGNYTCSNEVARFLQLYRRHPGLFCHRSLRWVSPTFTGTIYPSAYSPACGRCGPGSYSNDSRTRLSTRPTRRWDSRMAHSRGDCCRKPGNSLLRPAASREGYNDVKLVRTSTADEFFLLETDSCLVGTAICPGMACLCGISISMQQPGPPTE